MSYSPWDYPPGPSLAVMLSWRGPLPQSGIHYTRKEKQLMTESIKDGTILFRKLPAEERNLLLMFAKDEIDRAINTDSDCARRVFLDSARDFIYAAHPDKGTEEQK